MLTLDDPKAYQIDTQVVFHESLPLPSGCQLDTVRWRVMMCLHASDCAP